MRSALAAQLDSEAVWDGKRRSISGTAIPVDFPSREKLTAYCYLALEELAGADATELKKAGLTSAQAAAVVAAIG
jgi:hypothetical protein